LNLNFCISAIDTNKLAIFSPYRGSTTNAAIEIEKEGGGEAAVCPGGSECMVQVTVRFGPVSKCIAFSVNTTNCDELRLLVERAFKEHVPASIPRLRLMFDGREIPIGTQKLAELGLEWGKVEVTAELMVSVDCGGKEQNRQFKSIPCENVRLLIAAIKVDFDKWKEIHNPVYEERFPGDPMARKEVEWDGFSDSLKFFFEKTEKDPSKDYQQFYSNELRTIASSYVWRGTRLVDMAGWCSENFTNLKTYDWRMCDFEWNADFLLCAAEFDKPEYAGHRVFIDVLCVPQSGVKSDDVVGTTHSNYSGCWTVVFVDGNYLQRAWCAMEIAVSTNDGCRITVVGSCDAVSGKEFFDNITATNPSDISLIKREILNLFKTKEKFNGVVAKAMEVLFVEKHKRQVCELFNLRRADRPEWSRFLSVTQPPSLPRDRSRDYDVLSGAVDLNILTGASSSVSRALRIFLLSTLMDTLLEWSFFCQDVLPFLQQYARLCQLDLVLCDMRCGSREDEALPLETVMTEVERCRVESAGLCCIMILGDK
jgi:hypothetical protein